MHSAFLQRSSDSRHGVRAPEGRKCKFLVLAQAKPKTHARSFPPYLRADAGRGQPSFQVVRKGLRPLVRCGLHAEGGKELMAAIGSHPGHEVWLVRSIWFDCTEV